MSVSIHNEPPARQTSGTATAVAHRRDETGNCEAGCGEWPCDAEIERLMLAAGGST